jgi:MSHA pilin protein MshD
VKRNHLARGRQRGMTLVEVVTSIVVLGIAGSALLSVLSYLASTSGLTRAQGEAQAIANSYLSEALSKPFVDPLGADGETARNLFDDVDDYNGLDTATATDQAGGALGAFRVRIAVVAGTLGALPAADVRRVDVRVDYGGGQSVLASGYRTRYP